MCGCFRGGFVSVSFRLKARENHHHFGVAFFDIIISKESKIKELWLSLCLVHFEILIGFKQENEQLTAIEYKANEGPKRRLRQRISVL